jgi:hypothetical protein
VARIGSSSIRRTAVNRLMFMSRVTTQFAKFWLDPLRHDHSLGFRPAELRRIGSIIAEQQATLLKAGHEYFAK